MKLATLLFYGFALGLVAVGLREVLTGFEEDRCSMTYMFQYPEFRRVPLPHRVARRYPAYGLYLYGEGAYAQETRELQLFGAPVIFLHGNSGSYKQVRSLGSVALRKAESAQGGLHFNVFTVDFNEELVALYGGSLRRQTLFLHESIKAILKLYKTPPQSVVLVGHSMGGLVARALFTLPNFNASLVRLIITQATPHLAPVLVLDHYLRDFYLSLRKKWVQQADELRNVTVLSIGGGHRDYQVRSGLISIPCSPGDPTKLSLVATAVPRTWVSTDHLSIVWCKELVLTTVRAFFDLIDPETRQVRHDNQAKKSAVLNHHFVRHPARMNWPRCSNAFGLRGGGGSLSVLHGATPLHGSTRLNGITLCGLQFTLECEWQRQQSVALSLPVPHVLSLGEFEVTVSSSGLFHTIELKHFHEVHVIVPWLCHCSVDIFCVFRSIRLSEFTLPVSVKHGKSQNLSCIVYSLLCRTVPRLMSCLLAQILRFFLPMVPVYTTVTLLLACGGQLSNICKTQRAASMSLVLYKGLQPHKVNLCSSLLISCSWLKSTWSLLCLPMMDVAPPIFPDTNVTGGSADRSILTIMCPGTETTDGRKVLASHSQSGKTNSAHNCNVTYGRAHFQRSRNSLQAPQKHRKHSITEARECNSAPLLSECALWEVKDDLQLHLCLSALLTIPVILSAPSLVYWSRNLGYSTQLDPDPYWPYFVPLCVVYLRLINCNTQKLTNSKLLHPTSFLPLPVSVAMVIFCPMHLYRVTYFLLGALVPLALCCVL
uniref:GPI inositol-deacylase n=1 Tax=Hippocampus comes TaxID=109280 RepID=A0A3Q2YIB2_HIPCM